jgi:hypothetical protein
MNPFKFSPDHLEPPYANPSRVQWMPRQQIKLKWPADYRIFMDWAFALTILTSLLNVARAIFHPHSRTLLQNGLVGPMFFSVTVAMNGIALLAIWKDKSWARWWAVAASSLFLLDFLRQFIIPVRPAWDHYLSSLIMGVIGVVAFSWRDKQAVAAHSD